MPVGIDSVIGSTGGKVTIGTDPTYVEIPHIRNWKINKTNESNAYASTSNSGWKGKTMGPKDWSGSITVYADETDVTGRLDDVCPIGTVKDARFYLGDGSLMHYGKVFIESIEMEVSPEDGKPIGATINFQGHGALTEFAVAV